LEAAANDVRDRVSRAMRNLPADVDPPNVSKADAESFILSLLVRSENRSLLELSDIGSNVFKERLQTIPGVSSISIWGEKKYAMRLLIDPAKLVAYGLTPLDVRTALNRENVELPAGRIEGNQTELSIRTFGRLTTPDEFENLVIKDMPGGTVVKYRDIGRAVLAPENERTLLRGNGKIPMIGIAVTPQPGSNYIEIADEFYKRVDEIKKDLPADVETQLAIDNTQSIRKAILEVEETILLAFALVVLVIFAFLRDWRTTLIPVLAIPISLVGGFFIMYAFDFSINILTLLGIVLATGLVVDDAIVVLENIYHKIEKGMDPIEAGHEGSREIVFAIISTTITLAAVFLPVIFLEGATGRLFREFGIVVAGTVIISALVSLTLTPMMSARFLNNKKKHGKFFAMTERFYDRLTEAYESSLRRFMTKRWLAFGVMAVSFGAIYFIGGSLPSEIAPLEDKSRFQIRMTAPEGTSFESMNAYIGEVLDVVDTMAEKAAIVAVTSPGFGASATNSGFVRLSLIEPTERQRTQQEIVDDLNKRLREKSFARSFVIQEQTIQTGGRAGQPIQLVIQAPNFEKLREQLPKFMEKVQQDPAFAQVDLDLKFTKPELGVEVDRQRAQAMGVSIRDIAETLQLYYSGQRYGYFIMDGKQYQVFGQAEREDRNDPLDLSSITVRSKYGELVQLDNLVKTTDHSSPPQLYRYNRYVSATVSANTSEGISLGQGIEKMQQVARETFDPSFSFALAGTSKEFAESSSSLMFAFLLALVLIYLILAAQFESFRDPLTIMFTVPLALAGALAALYISNETLNIFSQIGIIVLIGIVTKNGILIVEFANQRAKEFGLSANESVIGAAAQRLRPILMTSLATMLGVLPIALALGAAAKSRVGMGIAIIGGLMFSLVLTLYVIPALYSYLAKKRVHKHSLKEEFASHLHPGPVAAGAELAQREPVLS
ncbi:MAG TPA: efflux RND transporter permease subunit, partial [Candidatus Kapabacteria bacterium]|nr:efflux RND transporter permease subunit [Candidatus Kapabacteria bacterium]